MKLLSGHSWPQNKRARRYRDASVTFAQVLMFDTPPIGKLLIGSLMVERIEFVISVVYLFFHQQAF